MWQVANGLDNAALNDDFRLCFSSWSPVFAKLIRSVFVDNNKLILLQSYFLFSNLIEGQYAHDSKRLFYLLKKFEE